VLYFVESDLSDRSLEGEWHAWYATHIERILTVPGFLSAQRFRATHATPSPFAAIYGIRDAGVMTSEPYRARFGPDSAGVWKQRMTCWKRNLLEGMAEMPEVPPQGWVAVMDRHTADAPPLPPGYAALQPVGLDRTVAQRGVLLGVDRRATPNPIEQDAWSLRVFRPMTPRLLSSTFP